MGPGDSRDLAKAVRYKKTSKIYCECRHIVADTEDQGLFAAHVEVWRG
jgi:hypothetical protein